MQRSSKNITGALNKQFNRHQKFQKESVKVIQNKEYQRSKARWPENNEVEQPDWRLSMPGNIGLLSDQTRDLPQNADLNKLLADRKNQEIDSKLKPFDDHLETATKVEHSIQDTLYKQYKDQSLEELAKERLSLGTEKTSENLIKMSNDNKDTIKFTTQKLPRLLKKDVENTFLYGENTSQINVSVFQKVSSQPSQQSTNASNAVTGIEQKSYNYQFNRGNQHLNSITSVAFKTKNDMIGWNKNVQIERLDKINEFTKMAEEISFLLMQEGYYCDFIDPMSGLPWFSKPKEILKNQRAMIKLEETNENFNDLSCLEIEDLGCCKVLMHRDFGKHVFVGTIVSNCPEDHWLLKKLGQAN